ncbi:MAG: hypothetical protein WC763_02375 [Candidatus Paceibacterota bacterium]
MVKDTPMGNVLTVDVFFAGMDSVRTELGGKIGALDQKLSGRIDSLEKRLDSRIDALESKMMEGFTALDKKTDIVERGAEQRDRVLSSQIQHMAFSKADWNDIV